MLDLENYTNRPESSHVTFTQLLLVLAFYITMPKLLHNRQRNWHWYNTLIKITNFLDFTNFPITSFFFFLFSLY